MYVLREGNFSIVNSYESIEKYPYFKPSVPCACLMFGGPHRRKVGAMPGALARVTCLRPKQSRRDPIPPTAKDFHFIASLHFTAKPGFVCYNVCFTLVFTDH